MRMTTLNKRLCGFLGSGHCNELIVKRSNGGGELPSNDNQFLFYINMLNYFQSFVIFLHANFLITSIALT